MSKRDRDNCDRIEAFCACDPDPFGRLEERGHVTASALVTNAQRDHVLLLHHAKLGLWLPPGGHCDSDSDVLRVARREAFEETGQADLALISEEILDIDVHAIPGKDASRRHLHYDVRFAFEGDMGRPLVVNNEALEARWVPVAELGRYTHMSSVLILVDKLEKL